MKLLNVDKDNEYGKYILATQQLGNKVKNLSWVFGIGFAAVLSYSVYTDIKASSHERPYVIDTMTGPIIVDYKHVMEKFTVEERALVAKRAYEGLRRRIGITEVDADNLNEWKNIITNKGVVAWSSLGDRWAEPNRIKHGFTRTLKNITAKPDLSTPYAFTIEAIETDFEEGKPRSKASYRVRLTLFFTDPKIDGVSRIDGVELHSEEPV